MRSEDEEEENKERRRGEEKDTAMIASTSMSCLLPVLLIDVILRHLFSVALKSKESGGRGKEGTQMRQRKDNANTDFSSYPFPY